MARRVYLITVRPHARFLRDAVLLQCYGCSFGLEIKKKKRKKKLDLSCIFLVKKNKIKRKKWAGEE